MWIYEIRFESSPVPPMTNLGQPTISAGATSRDVSTLVFAPGDVIALMAWDGAVGKRCVVHRTDDEDGRKQECGGVVARVTPHVVVKLNGAGWG